MEGDAENGYYFPIVTMTADDTAAYHRQLEKLESKSKGNKLGNKGQLNYPHVIYCFANEIARNSVLLDAVEAIIGPDIMLWGSTFFFEEPRTQSYVSWHQDLRNWGLQDGEAMVSAWLALTPANKTNGCMRFVPGSHKGELVNHSCRSSHST